MDRRDFMKHLPVITAGLAGSGALLGATGCAGVTYLTPVTGPDSGDGESLAIPSASVGSSDHAWVEFPGSNRPILLLRDEAAEGGWIALHARCTHRGCQPDPVGDRLVCPCHGSEFSRTGEVLEGPADGPLRRFPARQAGGRIVITVGGAA